MKRPDTDVIFHTAAAPDRAWSNRDLLMFHAFNPNGLYAQKRSNDNRVSALVDAGKAKSGALIAYGVFDQYLYDRMQELLALKRLPSAPLRAWIHAVEINLKTVDAFVASH